MKLLAALTCALLLSAPAYAGSDCHSGAEKKAEPAAAKAKPAAEKTKAEPAVLVRGEKLAGAPAVKLADLLARPEAHEGKVVQVEGTVRKACTKKGCWMELAEGEQGDGMRVTFKNYGFFVPLDSAGSTARVEGTVKLAALSEANAKHLEAEGATVPKDKDGKPREVQFVATGVELRR